MKCLVRSVSIALFLCMTGPLAWANAGWTSKGRIGEVQVNQFGRILLRLEVGENPSGCTDKVLFHRDQSAGTEQMLKTLLAAVAAGSQVSVYVTGVCHFKGYSEFSDVSLTP